MIRSFPKHQQAPTHLAQPQILLNSYLALSSLAHSYFQILRTFTSFFPVQSALNPLYRTYSAPNVTLPLPSTNPKPRANNSSDSVLSVPKITPAKRPYETHKSSNKMDFPLDMIRESPLLRTVTLYIAYFILYLCYFVIIAMVPFTIWLVRGIWLSRHEPASTCKCHGGICGSIQAAASRFPRDSKTEDGKFRAVYVDSAGAVVLGPSVPFPV
jgi:hypothetical protein